MHKLLAVSFLALLVCSASSEDTEYDYDDADFVFMESQLAFEGPMVAVTHALAWNDLNNGNLWRDISAFSKPFKDLFTLRKTDDGYSVEYNTIAYWLDPPAHMYVLTLGKSTTNIPSTILDQAYCLQVLRGLAPSIKTRNISSQDEASVLAMCAIIKAIALVEDDPASFEEMVYKFFSGDSLVVNAPDLSADIIGKKWLLTAYREPERMRITLERNELYHSQYVEFTVLSSEKDQLGTKLRDRGQRGVKLAPPD